MSSSKTHAWRLKECRDVREFNWHLKEVDDEFTLSAMRHLFSPRSRLDRRCFQQPHEVSGLSRRNSHRNPSQRARSSPSLSRRPEYPLHLRRSRGAAPARTRLAHLIENCPTIHSGRAIDLLDRWAPNSRRATNYCFHIQIMVQF